MISAGTMQSTVSEAVQVAVTPVYDERQAGKIRRRVARFKQAGLLTASGDIRIFQAISLNDLTQAYRLVHDVFVQKNYIQPQPGGVRVREFEALPEMATFVAKVDGRVVAVMSVVPDSQDIGLPSDKVFSKELEALRSQNRRVGEITNLVVTDEYRNSAVFLELTRCAYAHAVNIGLTDFFVSISPGHCAFFEHLLSFESWGDERCYDKATHDVVEGKRLNLEQGPARIKETDDALGDDAFLCDWFLHSNPHFGYTKLSSRIASMRFRDPALLRELFVSQSGMLTRCSQAVQDAIQQRWGLQVYHQVLLGGSSWSAAVA
ncbi:MAG: hypothetical protein K8S99_13675 [Planctomycetes bacterium]|nr:hypothetical protein [Planctomycetota bacterium]